MMFCKKQTIKFSAKYFSLPSELAGLIQGECRVIERWCQNATQGYMKENWMSIWLSKAILIPILLLGHRAVIKEGGEGGGGRGFPQVATVYKCVPGYFHMKKEET